MWRVLAILLLGSCYSSAEQLKLNVVKLPVEPSPAPALVNSTDGGRIIGGTPASIQSYPYAVQVLHNNQLACGGSILTQRHVLSAAHCFVNYQGVLQSASLFSCRVGTATLNTGGALHRVSTIINHELYNIGAVRDNDISVLLLATAVSYGSSVGPASIPSQGGLVPDNAAVWVIGWGQTNVNIHQASTTLNHVQVYTVNHTVCWQRYYSLGLQQSQPYPVTSTMMCTGVLDVGGRDACQGDSGGPVVYAGVVVGVTSWGEGCAHPSYPGVNARVSAYTNWINSTVTRYNAASSLGQTSVVLLLVSFLVSAAFSNTL